MPKKNQKKLKQESNIEAVSEEQPKPENTEETQSKNPENEIIDSVVSSKEPSTKIELTTAELPQPKNKKHYDYQSVKPRTSLKFGSSISNHVTDLITKKHKSTQFFRKRESQIKPFSTTTGKILLIISCMFGLNGLHRLYFGEKMTAFFLLLLSPVVQGALFFFLTLSSLGIYSLIGWFPLLVCVCISYYSAYNDFKTMEQKVFHFNYNQYSTTSNVSLND